MDYDSLTLLELKTMCKDRGLKVSGNKAEVVIRLMEDDESKMPQSVSIPQQQVNYGQQQMYGQQMYGGQPQQIFITNNTTSVVQITGFLIILYGLFRLFWGIFADDEEYFFVLFIGTAFVFSGILSVQGYRVGLYFALITLVISGLLSLIYIDKQGSFLSVGQGTGEGSVGFSLFCSGFCMLIVALPLLTADPSNFRDGSPKYLRSLIDTADWFSPIPLLWGGREDVETKVVINCAHCDSPLKVPSDYKGKVKCPTCEERFEIE